MSKFQRLIILVGCSGVLLNVFGLILDSSYLNYFSIFIGRLAALLYVVEIDKFRYVYLIPLTLSGINAIVNIEQILFAEFLSQSLIYQIACFQLFTSIKYKKPNG